MRIPECCIVRSFLNESKPIDESGHPGTAVGSHGLRFWLTSFKKRRGEVGIMQMV